MIEAHIFTGFNADNPRGMDYDTVDDIPRREGSMPQDYVWRGLGEFIAMGPDIVPQTVDCMIKTRKGFVRARAVLSYVEVDAEGEPIEEPK